MQDLLVSLVRKQSVTLSHLPVLLRKYSIPFNQPPNDKEIRFGSFCRLGKLDFMTLNTWANALRYFPESKLYFVYTQSNKVSEHYTKNILNRYLYIHQE